MALAPAAGATSGAHFFGDTGASIVQSGPNQGQLLVQIDEAGLGNQDVNYNIPWTSSATWACINGGGNHPKAANKETVSSSGSTDVNIQAKNGRVQATVPVADTPPGPGSFSCPPGQRLVLASVSYSVTINDTTNGVSAGPFTPSATFYNV
ncbi:MAG TPA: hypothetical protein VE152_07035 [Acidimicrobiales bacterium]|nr:hypothetical protein [Acidimicrobiales bacterium]